MRNVIPILLGLMVLLAACTTADGEMMEHDAMEDYSMMDKDDSMMESDHMEEDAMMEKDDSMMEESMEHDAMEDDHMDDSMMMEETTFMGEVLAGDKSKALVFNQEDYEKALADNKVVLLDFFATWCPICLKEQKELHAALEEIDDENLVSFRVNYKDPDTDDDERALAAEYGIVFQHTKVIIKDGEQQLKALDAWDKDRFVSELGRFL